MLSTIKLDSWADFEKIIEGELRVERTELITGPNFYRGHSDSTWGLETTLERYVGPNQNVASYYLSIKNIQSQIETFTDHNWDLPSYQEYVSNLISDGMVLTDGITIYMQYLRHFGYPSPLLDWTRSPFVAAYFAFRDVTSTSESIAIYSLLAASQLWLNRPSAFTTQEDVMICPISTFARKNKRHYLQQSVYTVCLSKINEQVCYASHEDPYIIGKDDDNYYFGKPITKYVIPATERLTALHSLEAHNINAYSLMGTEESLLESMFLRQYITNEINKNIYPDTT